MTSKRRRVRVRPIRDHSSFLRGYVAEDEGLYDDPEAGPQQPTANSQ
jgi:hypothetical protein